jgi:hypothetical protein
MQSGAGAGGSQPGQGQPGNPWASIFQQMMGGQGGGGWSNYNPSAYFQNQGAGGAGGAMQPSASSTSSIFQKPIDPTPPAAAADATPAAAAPVSKGQPLDPGAWGMQIPGESLPQGRGWSGDELSALANSPAYQTYLKGFAK